jgi:hypothetical protein
MKYFVMAVASLLLASCAVKQPEPFKIDTEKYPVNADAMGIEVLKTNSARESYKWYFGAKYHKAFAQSESGAWGYEPNKMNASSAMRSALDRCKKHNKANEANEPCQIINVDDYWASEL